MNNDVQGLQKILPDQALFLAMASYHEGAVDDAREEIRQMAMKDLAECGLAPEGSAFKEAIASGAVGTLPVKSIDELNAILNNPLELMRRAKGIVQMMKDVEPRCFSCCALVGSSDEYPIKSVGGIGLCKKCPESIYCNRCVYPCEDDSFCQFHYNRTRSCNFCARGDNLPAEKCVKCNMHFCRTQMCSGSSEPNQCFLCNK